MRKSFNLNGRRGECLPFGWRWVGGGRQGVMERGAGPVEGSEGIRERLAFVQRTRRDSGCACSVYAPPTEARPVRGTGRPGHREQ